MALAITRDDYIAEILSPDPDGINSVFHTSHDYRPESLYVWLNGVLVVDGATNDYVMLGGNAVEMNVTPRIGDTIEARYNRI